MSVYHVQNTMMVVIYIIVVLVDTSIMELLIRIIFNYRILGKSTWYNHCHEPSRRLDPNFTRRRQTFLVNIIEKHILLRQALQFGIVELIKLYLLCEKLWLLVLLFQMYLRGVLMHILRKSSKWLIKKIFLVIFKVISKISFYRSIFRGG